MAIRSLTLSGRLAIISCSFSVSRPLNEMEVTVNTSFFVSVLFACSAAKSCLPVLVGLVFASAVFPIVFRARASRTKVISFRDVFMESGS